MNKESELYQYLVETIIIDNCHVKDEQLSLILEAVLEQKSLKEFVYIKNELSKKSVEVLTKILDHTQSGVFLR